MRVEGRSNKQVQFSEEVRKQLSLTTQMHSSYSDQHRLFLQAFMAKPFQPEAEAKKLFRKVHTIYEGILTFLSSLQSLCTFDDA
jgi:hypothetical protein